LREQFSPELAFAFLEQAPDPGQHWRPAFALERARAKREYAAKVSQYYGALLLVSARQDLLQAQKDAQPSPLEPLIRFELARLEAAEGSKLLARPAQGGPKLSASELKQVQAKLSEAAKQLAACTIPEGRAPPVLLAATESEFPGLLIFARARTALEQAWLAGAANMTTERAAAIRQAIAYFTQLARRDPESRLSWKGMAWLYLCQLENDDAKAAQKTLRDLNASRSKSAERGKQLAKALRLLWLIRENDIRSQSTIQADSEDWLHQNPALYDSPPGWELRLHLAQRAFAQTAGAAAKPGARSREALERAWRLCSDVDIPERDDAGINRARRIQLAKSLYPEILADNAGKPTTTFDGWLRSQVAFADLSSTANNTPAPQRTRALDTLKSLLQTTLTLPDARQFPREVIECKQLLTYCFYMSGDLARAAEEGEALARKQVHSVTAAQAGNLALQALAALAAQNPAKTDENDSRSYRSRLHALAQFLIQSRPHQPSVDTTRHLLALALGREKKYPQALDQLDLLSPAYPEFARASYQGASLCLEAAKAKDPVAAGLPAYRDRALRFLEKLPSPGNAQDARQLQTIFAGKRLLIEIYLQAKQSAEVDRVVRDTIASFHEIDDKARESFRIPLLALQMFGASLGAERACQAGRFQDGSDALAPLRAILRDPANTSLASDLKQHEASVLTRFLDLSIRTAVLDGQTQIAREQLKLLTQLFPDNPLELLGATIQVLGEQIRSLRKQGKSAEALLQKTAESVSAFLDYLAEQQKNVTRPESLLFLAESYASLEQYARAAAFASRILPPEQNDDARSQQIYRTAQVLLLRSLRAQKDWKRADSLLASLLATNWGPNSLDLKKERLYLRQDQGKFTGKQGAILGWNTFMLQLQPRLQDNRLREIYFEGYYQLTYCIYRSALEQTDSRTREKELKLAANYILKLEAQADPAADSCKHQLQELLTSAAPLREQYEALKKVKQP
jgi:hypothetical protein